MVTPLIYATADRVYYDQNAEAFVNSAEKHGMEVKIDLVGNQFEDLRKKLNPTEPRVFYCFLRFLLLPELLDKHENILVIDIDSVFNSKIEIDEKYDMGLFFRDWVHEEDKKILCGASYFTQRARSFAERVRDKLLCGKNEWYDDQLAFWKTYQEIGQNFNIMKMDHRFLNYNFESNAPIWTAKGKHRKQNPRYLARKRIYEAEYAYQ